KAGSTSAILCQAAAEIETKPADPKKTGADYTEWQIMRRHRFETVTDSLAEQECCHQGRCTRTDMHDRPASEIQRAHFAHPSLDTPNPMGQGVINERGPEHDENEKRAKLYPLCKRAGDQRGSDHSKHHLVNHESSVRYGGGIVRIGVGSDAIETDPVAAADQTADVRTESPAVCPQRPLQKDDGDNDGAMHDGTKDVLATHQAAVEEKQTRNRH